ncbi:uncharacterized protein LOC142336418 [Convolutriloba macropyga]|uniref:uncharacterized protein LOC142336418 n=1 Tax=Convolutriloba macropyga TaxID=536237 RepID=UPI003F52110D
MLPLEELLARNLRSSNETGTSRLNENSNLMSRNGGVLYSTPSPSAGSGIGGEGDEGGLLGVIEVIESCVNVSVGVIGLIGAIVVILVYTWRHNPTPSELIITALSVVDLLYNVFNNISNLLFDRLRTPEQLQILFAFSCGSFSFSLVASFLLISTISINRWFAICRPLTYMTSFSKTKVQNVMLGVFGVSVMQGGVSFCYAFIPAERKTVRRVIDVQNYMFLNLLVITALAIMLYSYFHIIKTFKRQNEKLRKPQIQSVQYVAKENHSEHDREETNKPCTSSNTNEISFRDGGGHNGSLVAVDTNHNSGCNSSSPPALTIEDDHNPPRRLMVEANSRKYSQPTSGPVGPLNSHRSSASRDPKNKVTFTLFIISTCFLICVSPFLIFENLVFFLEWEENKRQVQIARKLTRILFLLNFVSNPLIYLATSQIFRERLAALVKFVVPQRLQRLFSRPDAAEHQPTHVTLPSRQPSCYASRV